MCVIAVQTIGAKISDERIRQLYASNPDGAGIMWAQGGKVHWRKGFFSVDKLIEEWHKIPAGVTAAIHCRITTHGGTCTRLCHPFPLTHRAKDVFRLKGKANAVLMHNGIMSFMERDEHYNKKTDSDSSAYAKKLHDMFGGARLPMDDAEKEEIRKETSGNRILIMDGSGAIFTAGEWTWEDGILYSNTHFKWRSNYSSYGTGFQGYPHSGYYNSWDDDDDYVLGLLGGSKSKNNTSGITVHGGSSFRNEEKGCITYEDSREDEPESPSAKGAAMMSKDELFEYADKQSKWPVEYFGKACWFSTGEEVRGSVVDDLYCDAAGNVYELDEDTLRFTLRSDMYLDERDIDEDDSTPLVPADMGAVNAL